jgi:phosphoglycolate phosphatase
MENRLVSYRVIAWDFDGTLADSLDGALRIYNQLAAEYGLVPIDDPTPVRQMTIPAFLKAHRISLAKVPVLYSKFLKAQASQMASVRLHEGIPEVVGKLQEREYRLAVISSNTPENIRVCLRANGVEERFEFVLGYSRLFGKESAIRGLIKSLKLAPRDLLYVGDEVRDINAARKAGVTVASVCWGFNSEEALAAEHPEYIVHTPAELLNVLDGQT